MSTDDEAAYYVDSGSKISQLHKKMEEENGYRQCEALDLTLREKTVNQYRESGVIFGGEETSDAGEQIVDVDFDDRSSTIADDVNGIRCEAEAAFWGGRPCKVEASEESAETSSASTVTYKVLKNASQKQTDILSDSLGFTYTRIRSSQSATFWRCTMRNKHAACHATVSERHGVFSPGRAPHSHDPIPGQDVDYQVRNDVKQSAVSDRSKPALTIVYESLAKNIGDNQQHLLPKPDRLARAAKRIRLRLQSQVQLQEQNPSDLSFELKLSSEQQSFLQDDVKIDSKRHLIFATAASLRLLRDAKRWFLDGSCKAVIYPFLQVYSISAFVKHDDCVKHVPLLFALMSARRKQDYRAVLNSVKLLLSNAPIVEEITLGSDAVEWRSVASVFPTVKMSGCAYHWSQSVWAKMQALRLQECYHKNQSVSRYCNKLLVLPLLPDSDVSEVFEQLQAGANTPELTQLCGFIENLWIGNKWSKPGNWSVFNRIVRTRVDVEGWTLRLPTSVSSSSSSSKSGQTSFYNLIGSLFSEIQNVTSQMQPMSEKKVTGELKKRSPVHLRLFETWDEYAQQSISVEDLLSRCAQIYVDAFYFANV